MIHIREYNQSDAGSILALFRLNTPKFFSQSEEQDLIEYLGYHIDHYYVVEDKQRIIGCGGINFSEDMTSVRISWDIIHPDYQGKGVGSLLVRHRLEKIKEYPRIKTIIVRTSQVAYRFYEKQGFILKEVVKDYWAKGFDLYYMERLDV